MKGRLENKEESARMAAAKKATAAPEPSTTKPCPFCGEQPAVMAIANTGEIVRCENRDCGLYFWSMHANRWNMRATAAPEPCATKLIADRLETAAGFDGDWESAYRAMKQHAANLEALREEVEN